MGKVRISLTLDEDVLEWTDHVAENLEMSRSEFINMILSGGRDAKELVDRIIDKWFDQKKSEMKAKLELPATYSRKEAR